MACLAFLPSAISCGSGGSVDANTGSVGDSPPDSAPAPPDTLPSDTLPPAPPPDSTPSTPVVPQSGTPFGMVDLWINDTLRYGPAPFTMSMNFDNPLGIIGKINLARAMGHRLILGMTGGRHDRYTIDGKFDLGKWKARMDLFNTPEIRAAVAAAVADGTVLMANVMDEPNNFSWGGVMTKPLIDQMAAYVKAIFPTLIVGVSIRWDWRQEERYQVIDFIVTHYSAKFGSLTAWRDGALNVAKDNGVSVLFTINPLDGGNRISGCPLGSTGGAGTYSSNCRMTAGQIREFGSVLGVAGCALMVWKYEPKLMSNPDNVQAFKDLAAMLATHQAPPCRRH
jgi:hypothetical protein